jgi:hypothetical protein
MDLVFGQYRVEFLVEGTGRLEVMAEGLLDHDGRVLREARLSQLGDHLPEESGGDLKVEERPGGTLQQACQRCVGSGIGEVTLEIGESLGQAGQRLVVEALSGVREGVSEGGTQLIV